MRHRFLITILLLFVLCKMDDPQGLEAALGSGKVTVVFEIRNQ